jgi:hypothetical protein
MLGEIVLLRGLASFHPRLYRAPLGRKRQRNSITWQTHQRAGQSFMQSLLASPWEMRSKPWPFMSELALPAHIRRRGL